MMRYVVLLSFTGKGLAGVKDSPARAEAFRQAADKVGAKIETVYWTMGAYDGVVVLSAADEATAAGLVLQLARGGNVKTSMLRAFDVDEFKAVLGKIG